ncbi:unnamed protein product, partial [Cladocopium goreaui]
QGFLRAVSLALRVKEDGLLLGGPPCGPWVFVNAGTHKRRLTNIWGDLGSRYVQSSNTLTARWALILLVGAVRCIASFTEQPGGSLMRHYPYIFHLRRMIREVLGGTWDSTFFYMGSFGHKALKPSRGLGSALWAKSLRKPISKAKREKLRKSGAGMVKKYQNAKGEWKLVGTPFLKQSAAYTPKFARTVCKLHLKYMETHKGHLRREMYGKPVEDLHKAKQPYKWKHANLQEIRKFLLSEVEAGRYCPVLDL